MREIKFRFWDTEQPAMWTQEDIIEFQQDEDNAAYNIFNNMLGDDHWIPMQYTGLKDKNGKEIYEGDIVKQPMGSYIIQSCAGGFECQELNGSLFIISVLSTRYCEVIGNIYENKELLNAKA